MFKFYNFFSTILYNTSTSNKRSLLSPVSTCSGSEILLVFSLVKTELKNSFNIKYISKLSVVIAPFLSVRGATLCLVRDFDLAYEKNDYI